MSHAELDKKPSLKKALYDHALQSTSIYVPKGKANDIAYFKNYEQKWYKDNQTNNAIANGRNTIPEVIYSTYYKDDLMAFTGEYNDEEVIENDRYKIVCFFRSNIIGYDKNKKQYFPIFIESCVTGCNKQVKFLSRQKIEITYTEGGDESYTIDLNKMKFEK